MSDRRHTPRPSLPEGYQYGDARPEPINPEGMTFEHEGMIYRLGSPMIFEEDAALRESSERYVRPAIARAFDQNDSAWRAPHENAAAQLKRRQQEGGAAIAKHFSDEANARMFRLSCPDLEERTGAEPV